MAVDLRRIRRLVEAQAAARQSITDRFTTALRRRWRAPRPRFYEPTWVDDSARWSADLARTTADTWAQQAARHIELQLAEIDERFTATDRQRRELVLPDRYRDVDPMVQWRRPANEYRWLISTGVPEDEALDRAVRRAVQIGEMDVQLADRAGSEARLNQPPGRAGAPAITGYRRVTHPELSRGGVCGLCLAAADRVYRRIESRAVHDGCYCTVLAIVDGEDPGSQLNANDLAVLYKAAGDSTDRQDLAKTRWKIEEHSELGPVLVQQGHHFRTLAEVEADRSSSPVDDTRDDPVILRTRQTNPDPAPASGDSPPPTDPPNTGQRTPDPEPDPSDKGAFRAYWKGRQDDIEARSDGRFRSNGAPLTPDEVRFVERFLARDEGSLSWIPKHEPLPGQQAEPTDDFVWLERGIVAELKSTKATYGKVKDHISDDAERGRQYGRKRNFVIDLGNAQLKPGLVTSLQKYNRRVHPLRRIERLWVLSENGLEFVEIDLLSPDE